MILRCNTNSCRESSHLLPLMHHWTVLVQPSMWCSSHLTQCIAMSCHPQTNQIIATHLQNLDIKLDGCLLCVSIYIQTCDTEWGRSFSVLGLNSQLLQKGQSFQMCHLPNPVENLVLKYKASSTQTTWCSASRNAMSWKPLLSIGAFTHTTCCCLCEQSNWQQWFPRHCIMWHAALRAA